MFFLRVNAVQASVLRFAYVKAGANPAFVLRGRGLVSTVLLVRFTASGLLPQKSLYAGRSFGYWRAGLRRDRYLSRNWTV